MHIKFTIHGNQDDPTHGNPIPYTRMLNHSRRKNDRRYQDWQEYIRGAFLIATRQIENAEWKPLVAASRTDQPIMRMPNAEMEMHLRIYWAGRNHGDPDNIFKSVADALFVDDKHLDGSFTAEHDPERRARVEVEIIINHKSEDQ